MLGSLTGPNIRVSLHTGGFRRSLVVCVHVLLLVLLLLHCSERISAFVSISFVLIVTLITWVLLAIWLVLRKLLVELLSLV